MRDEDFGTCDACDHLYKVHDDYEGCSSCHDEKEECIAWIVFSDDIEERL